MSCMSSVSYLWHAGVNGTVQQNGGEDSSDGQRYAGGHRASVDPETAPGQEHKHAGRDVRGRDVEIHPSSQRENRLHTCKRS